MTSNGLKKEAVRLREILNEKYNLEVNYTSSLRILEELKNNSNKNTSINGEDPVLGSVFTNDAPKLNDDLRIMINDYNSSENTLVSNIKNINQNAFRSKEKVVYFNFFSEKNLEFINSLEHEEYSQYLKSYRIFMKNFEVIEFDDLNNFINLDAKYLNELLTSVDKFFIDPMFFKINEELFIKLVHELIQTKFVGIMSPSSSKNTPYIYGLVENFKNYYDELYSNETELAKFYILNDSNMMMDYREALLIFYRRQDLISIRQDSFLASREQEKITLGFSRVKDILIQWDYDNYSNLLVKTNSENDVDYITDKIMQHFKKHEKIPTIRVINTFKELEYVIDTWPEQIERIKRQGGEEIRVDFMIINANQQIMDSEELQKIISLGRSLKLSVILVVKDKVTISSDISILTPKRIMFKGNYSNGRVTDFNKFTN